MQNVCWFRKILVFLLTIRNRNAKTLNSSKFLKKKITFQLINLMQGDKFIKLDQFASLLLLLPVNFEEHH